MEGPDGGETYLQQDRVGGGIGMLKRKLCDATITWQLECAGPLLIRDGRYQRAGSKADGCPDCLFISHKSDKEMTNVAVSCKSGPPELPFYVPGTSIRGPFRAHAERIIRSLAPQDASSHLTACDPFSQDEEQNGMPIGCSKQLENTDGTRTPYAEACPACKIFGCCGQASRIQFVDAEIKICTSVYRDMIGIDRFTGAVSKGDKGGANMRFHVLEQSKFDTTIRLVNFELWHLGLLAYVFRDFEEGLVPLGFGKTKGFGQVKGTVLEIVLSYPKEPQKLEHIGSLMNEEERKRYEILDARPGEYGGFEQVGNGLSLFPRFRVRDHAAFWQDVAPRFNQYMEALQTKKKEVS
jgi:CRISPR-associated RAMP protein (TIGR02581 family)